MDTNRLYALPRKLQKEGLKPEETSELSSKIFNMAGNNVITQFNANMQAQRESIQTQLVVMRWMPGVGFFLLGLLVAYGTFFAGG